MKDSDIVTEPKKLKEILIGAPIKSSASQAINKMQSALPFKN